MPDIELTTKKSLFENLNISLPPNNEILLDDLGNPSVMVKIPKFRYCDLFTGGSTKTHPAFIVGNKVYDYIYISKYPNVVEDSRGYSLPGVVPADGMTYDEAIAYCENKGKGWHLMSNAEWAALALWCKKHDTQPFGNNKGDGYDHYHTYDSGIIKKEYRDDWGEDVPFTLTGTGPKDWYHNHDYSGVADLNGNVAEWVSGVRLNNFEIQIIANNDVALHVDQTAASDKWKAILQDGTLVAPGTENALKFMSSGKIGTGSGSGSSTNFKNVSAYTGVTIPEILKGLALCPADAANTYKSDYLYTGSGTDRVCYRGGWCDDGSNAGVFYCCLDSVRSAYGGLGFRSAYVPL